MRISTIGLLPGGRGGAFAACLATHNFQLRLRSLSDLRHDRAYQKISNRPPDLYASSEVSWRCANTELIWTNHAAFQHVLIWLTRWNTWCRDNEAFATLCADHLVGQLQLKSPTTPSPGSLLLVYTTSEGRGGLGLLSTLGFEVRKASCLLLG